MVSITKNDRTEKLGITLHETLLHTFDNKRGDIPRVLSLEELSKVL